MEQFVLDTSIPIKRISSRQLERFLGVAAMVTIVAAWFIGLTREQVDLKPFLPNVIPQPSHFEEIADDTYAVFAADSTQSLIGYITAGKSSGFGGPLKVAVAVNLDGDITGLLIIDHRETPAWYRQVIRSKYISSLLGKSYSDSFQVGLDIDGVTGATYSSRAIAEAAIEGSRKIAARNLALPIPVEPVPSVQFGIPESVLIILFCIGFVGRSGRFKYRKQIRWTSMLLGLMVLGIIYNRPLSLVQINKFLMGFWPQWQTHLYWYLLIGGILFVLTAIKKNPYCQWFCPFGAAQECVGLIGGARGYSTGNFRYYLKWLRRSIVWLAIVVALIFRNPGLTSYEIFGTFFNLIGSNRQFLLLSFVLIAALFVRRPWCTYLCPVPPVEEFIRMLRTWGNELWQNRKIS